MKKLFLLFLICTPLWVSAQVFVGARAGINLASATGDLDGKDLEADNITGLVIAGLVIAPLGDDSGFEFQGEVSFIQKGYSERFIVDNDNAPDDTLNYQFNLDYVEVPLLIRYLFGSESIGGAVLGGPAFGYAINGTSQLNDGTSVDVMFGDEIAEIDISLHVGATLHIQVASGRLFLDARYMLGLTDLDKIFDNSNFKNTGIGISAGYAFKF